MLYHCEDQYLVSLCLSGLLRSDIFDLIPLLSRHIYYRVWLSQHMFKGSYSPWPVVITLTSYRYVLHAYGQDFFDVVFGLAIVLTYRHTRIGMCAVEVLDDGLDINALIFL